jgi:hypothetical protein
VTEVVTSGRAVRLAMSQGWELWHTSRDPLPGRWELRRGREVTRVAWAAVDILRGRYRGWLERFVESRHEGGYAWSYRCAAGPLFQPKEEPAR